MGGGGDTGTIGEMKSKLGVLSNKVRRTSKRLEERGEPAFLEMGRGPVLPDKSMMASGFGSYKDFIESTGDEELMDLYLEGLNSGDFTKLFEALRRKGYQGRDDIATGGLAAIINL